MKNHLVFIIIIVGMALVSNLVSADGAVFVNVNTTGLVNEPSQKAAIDFWNDIHGGQETLTISTKIQVSNTTNLAWLIPIPSKTEPDVKAADVQIFYRLAGLFTAPTYTSSGVSTTPIESITTTVVDVAFLFSIIVLSILFVILMIKKRWKGLLLLPVIIILILLYPIFRSETITYGYSTGATAAAQVQPIEIKKIDIYDTAILNATNATELVQWLNRNGYAVSENVTSILQEYCDKGNFYFIANKINLTNKYNTSSDIEAAEKQLAEGTATPLEITFQPDKPFYPMKISSINEGNTDIVVYITSNSIFFDNSGILKVSGVNNNYGHYYTTLLEYNGDLKQLKDDSIFENTSYAILPLKVTVNNLVSPSSREYSLVPLEGAEVDVYNKTSSNEYSLVFTNYTNSDGIANFGVVDIDNGKIIVKRNDGRIKTQFFSSYDSSSMIQAAVPSLYDSRSFMIYFREQQPLRLSLQGPQGPDDHVANATVQIYKEIDNGSENQSYQLIETLTTDSNGIADFGIVSYDMIRVSKEGYVPIETLGTMSPADNFYAIYPNKSYTSINITSISQCVQTRVCCYSNKTGEYYWTGNCSNLSYETYGTVDQVSTNTCDTWTTCNQVCTNGSQTSPGGLNHKCGAVKDNICCCLDDSNICSS